MSVGRSNGGAVKNADVLKGLNQLSFILKAFMNFLVFVANLTRIFKCSDNVLALLMWGNM